MTRAAGVNVRAVLPQIDIVLGTEEVKAAVLSEAAS
jgi:hypothetical protein